MNKKIIFIIIVSSLLTANLIGQSSQVNWSVFDMGNGKSLYQNSQSLSVIGQSITGISKGNNTIIKSGFFTDSLVSSPTVGNISDIKLPEKFFLYQNYPNPFNPRTTIKFDLPFSSIVNLAVYNLLGEEVEVILNNEMTAGTHKKVFEAAHLASGIYFFKIIISPLSSTDNNQFVKTIKFILLK